MHTSYHTHSHRSDGQTPIRDLVQKAICAGLDELGISDHYVFLPGDKTVSWSMPISSLPDYFAEIEEAEKEAQGKLVIRRGIEADFYPSTINELADVLKSYPFDFVIGSVHFVDNFCVDERKNDWDKLTETERNDMIRVYWDLITQMANTRLFDFVGHMDIYKKFGYLPTIDISQDISSALDSIAAADMAAELNTAGWHKEDILEAYPSQAIIEQCHARAIPMLVTTDAHKPEDLARSYDRGIKWLREAGYTEQAVFERRQRRMVALPQL